MWELEEKAGERLSFISPLPPPPVSAKPGFLLNPSACAKRGRRGGGEKEKKGREEKKKKPQKIPINHRNVARDLASFRLLSPEYPSSTRSAAVGKRTGKGLSDKVWGGGHIPARGGLGAELPWLGEFQP